jgi:hypothetical protein
MKKLAWLAILILGITQLFLLPGETSEALSLSDRCQGEDREACLSIEILAVAHDNPEQLIPLFDQFSALLKNKTLTDDPRIFSPIVHEVGMELAFNKIPPAEAFALCPLNFKAGCLHGVVMEALDDSHANDPKELLAFCDFAQTNPTYYSNCIHGIGHVLAAKTTGDLNETLPLCTLTDSALEHACTTGVFMEFSTGVHGTGHHTHEPPIGNILLPCAEVDAPYQNSCYPSMSSYRQYLPTTESFIETAQSCLAAPTEFQNACLLGLAEKILTSTAQDTNKAHTMCETLDSTQVESCKDSVDHINELESVL